MSAVFSLFVCTFAVASGHSMFHQRFEGATTLTKDLVREGLLHAEADGSHSLLCHITGEDGVTRSETCTLGPEEIDRSMGCMSVWGGDDIVKMGCWRQQDISLSVCTKRACLSQEKRGGFNFCCCFGDNCNAKYGEL